MIGKLLKVIFCFGTLQKWCFDNWCHVRQAMLTGLNIWSKSRLSKEDLSAVCREEILSDFATKTNKTNDDQKFSVALIITDPKNIKLNSPTFSNFIFPFFSVFLVKNIAQQLAKMSRTEKPFCRQRFFFSFVFTWSTEWNNVN